MKINLTISLEDEQIEFLKKCDKEETQNEGFNDLVRPLLHFGLIKKTGQFQEWGSFYPVYSITPLGRLVLASMN